MNAIRHFALTMLAIACSTSAYSLEIESFTPDKFLDYKTVGKTKLKLHIFTPKGHKQSDKRPAIVFLGTKDKLIPVNTAKEYKRLMEEQGCRCDLHLYDGQPHGFFNYSRADNYTQTVIQMDLFLASLGYLKGEPTLQNKPENILERITFYDIDSKPLAKELTAEEKRLYLREIKKDMTYFRKSYERAQLRVDVSDLDPEQAARRVKQAVNAL